MARHRTSKHRVADAERQQKSRATKAREGRPKDNRQVDAAIVEAMSWTIATFRPFTAAPSRDQVQLPLLAMMRAARDVLVNDGVLSKHACAAIANRLYARKEHLDGTGALRLAPAHPPIDEADDAEAAADKALQALMSLSADHDGDDEHL